MLKYEQFELRLGTIFLISYALKAYVDEFHLIQIYKLLNQLKTLQLVMKNCLHYKYHYYHIII